MTLSNDLLFLDTETVGLELEHDVWEIAFAIGEGQILSYVVPHSLRNADPKALEMNGYHRRAPQKSGDLVDVNLAKQFEGKTIVGANPAFDAYRLHLRWGKAPWHYRMIDVETMAGYALRWDKPLGLKDITEYLKLNGWHVPQPDHSAAGDVATVREVYRALLQRRDRSYA